jgi:hypothetical protein
VNDNRSSTLRESGASVPVLGLCEPAFRERIVGCTAGAMFAGCGDGGETAIGYFALVVDRTKVNVYKTYSFSPSCRPSGLEVDHLTLLQRRNSFGDRKRYWVDVATNAKGPFRRTVFPLPIVSLRAYIDFSVL